MLLATTFAWYHGRQLCDLMLLLLQLAVSQRAHTAASCTEWCKHRIHQCPLVGAPQLLLYRSVLSPYSLDSIEGVPKDSSSHKAGLQSHSRLVKHQQTVPLVLVSAIGKGPHMHVWQAPCDGSSQVGLTAAHGAVL